jgi:phosphatidylcholine synthase
MSIETAMDEPTTEVDPAGLRKRQRVRGYLVHVLTASGIIFAFLAMAELLTAAPQPAWVFGWLLAAVVVDAADGTLARRWEVKRTAPGIDGRTIDDLLDYLTFAFIPLMLVYRMGWVPTAGIWPLVFIALPMGASLLGFANVRAKEEAGGFFLGFPSYWNIAAFYAGLLMGYWGPWGNAVMLLVLAILTVTPVRFVYPTIAPPPYRWPVLIGCIVWGIALLMMLPWYPDDVPGWAIWASLSYPLIYTLVSFYLDYQWRQGAGPYRAAENR